MKKRFINDFVNKITKQIKETGKLELSSYTNNVVGAVKTNYSYSSDDGRITEELDIEFVNNSEVSVLVQRKFCVLDIMYNLSDPDTFQTRTFYLA